MAVLCILSVELFSSDPFRLPTQEIERALEDLRAVRDDLRRVSCHECVHMLVALTPSPDSVCALPSN